LSLQFSKSNPKIAPNLELKNDMVLQGTIIGMDVAMNTHMEDVTCIMPQRQTVLLKKLSIRGSTIRQFILPDQLNVDAILETLQKQAIVNTERAKQQQQQQQQNQQGKGARGGRGGRGGARGGRGGRGGRGR
jgi:small nuclear ribonucleoprotein D1